MHRNKLNRIAALAAGLMLHLQIAVPAAPVVEDLGEGKITAGKLSGGKAETLAGRQSARKSTLLTSGQASWSLPAGAPVLAEFWVRPWSWDAYAQQPIEVASFALDSGQRVSLRKRPGAATLELRVADAVVGTMPIYTWEETQAERGNGQQTRPAAWHQVAVELGERKISWAVDGFAGPVNGGVLRPWKSGRLVLGDKKQATAYSDLVLRAGVQMAQTPESLRRQFKLSYSRVPDLRASLVSVPYVPAAPTDETALRDWVRENGAKLVAFTSIKGNRLLAEPLTGYIAYDDRQTYLLLTTPYQGELNVARIGRKDGPLWAQESYEMFLHPPLTGVPDYIQLIGNPLGDQTDLRPSRSGAAWNGQWQWQVSRAPDVWEGLLVAPFQGLDLPNPGDSAVWTGNIFNTEAGAVWAWTGSAYNDTGAFGTLRFSRQAPVIRPDNPVLQGDSLSLPVTIRAPHQSGRFQATLEVYAEGGILPVAQAQQELNLAAGGEGRADLKIPLADAENGLAVITVRDGDELVYSKSFRLPVEAPRVRAGLKAVSAPAATNETTQSTPAPLPELPAEVLAETLRNERQWKNTRLGLTEKVPSPWTPVQAFDGIVELWNRRYDLKDALFPQQVMSAGKSLLAAPMRLRLRQGEREVVFSKAQNSETIQENETGAAVRASQVEGGVKVSVTSEIEFDGMAKITLELQSADEAATFDGLTLEIPLRAEAAKLFHYSASYSGHNPHSDSGAVPAEGFKLDRLREIVWLGGSREGLTWFSEGTENWPLWDEKNIIVLEAENAGSRVLRIKLGERPFRLEQPLKIVFGLQATPMRPRPENFRLLSDKRSQYFPWTRGDGHYIPWTMYPEAPRQQVQEYRQQGREVMPVSSVRFYGRYHFAENDFYKLPESLAGLNRPEVYLWSGLWQISGSEPLTLPNLPTQQMAAGNWRGRKFAPSDLVNFCPNSTFQDFYLWKLHNTIEETDLGALYLDQPLFRCANRAHGCGYQNYNGEWVGHAPIFAMRDMAKRIRQLFYDKHGKALIRWHSSNHLIIPSLAYADVNWDGENYLWGPLKVGEFYSKTLPLDRMQVQHSGLPFGFAPDLLPEFGSTEGDRTRNAPSPASIRDMMGFFMVHDSTSSSAWTSHPALVDEIQRRRLEFPFEGTSAIYYWENDPRVQIQPGDVLPIAHVRPGGDMLYILFNNSDAPATSRTAFDLKALGFPAGEKVTVVDFYNNRPLGTTTGELVVDVAPRDFRMLRLTVQE